MRRWLALTTAGILTATGCRSGGDRILAQPAGRTAPTDERTLGPSRSGGADVLAGFVVTPDGQKARNVSVEYAPADGGSDGAPVEVRTDDAGYFRIERLTPNRNYVLTARAKQDDKPLGGRAYAKPGGAQSQRVTIQLLDGQNFPPLAAGFADDAPAGRMPKPADVPLPAPAFGPHDLRIPSSARADAGAPVDTLPAPTLPTPPPALTAADPPALPQPDRPPPLTVRPRSDARAEAPAPPSQPALMVIPPLTGPAGSRKADLPRTVNEFVLVDARGTDREFPARSRWVLLDFMSSTCVPCAKSVPVLNALQDRLAGKGLEVVGVLCDDAPLRERRELVAAYNRKHRPNYALLTEPADEPGALSARFNVTRWPTLVLLDGAGNVAWQGHPADIAEVERRVK